MVECSLEGSRLVKIIFMNIDNGYKLTSVISVMNKIV